jgi:hypothetical protein
VLVQPATVDRWHREGFRRWWRRRSRRPGRPCIDSPCRDLIRRIAAENWLWGAPRIHGELLKLGIAISERTVSRYLRSRPTTRSQTWRTFFANHLADRTFIWPVLFADARGDDVVVDASDVSARPVPLSRDGSCASTHWARVDWDRSLQRASRGVRLGPHHVHCTGARTSTGRDPPRHLRSQLASRRLGTGSFRACLQYLCDRRQCETIRPREFAIGSGKSRFVCNRVVNILGRPRSARRVGLRRDSHGGRNIGEGQRTVSGDSFARHARSRSGNSGICVRGRLHECGDKADTPRLRPKRASASIPLSGRSFGEAQDTSGGATS